MTLHFQNAMKLIALKFQKEKERIKNDNAAQAKKHNDAVHCLRMFKIHSVH